MLIRWLCIVVALGNAAGASAKVPLRHDAVAATTSGASLPVGTAVLRACGDAFCGRLVRPLDPTGTVPGTIAIAYRWYPHTRKGAAEGTLVTVEGGPGYGSIGSAADFLIMTGALRKTRDLLIVDNRGTGKSGALDCTPLQISRAQRQADVDLCAAQLAETGHLYGTRLAVADMIAVLDQLGVGKVDLYGDSYGTFFGQVFAAAAPDRVRSLVLDGAYQARGGSPWYPELYAALTRTGTTACQLSAPCADRPGSFAVRLNRLLARLRQNPPTGRVTDSNGARRIVTATAAQLFFVMANGGGGNTVFRDLDAAGRALLDDDDAVPLLRLVAEAQITGDGTSFSIRPSDYSKALFAAVSCSDYPQVYDLRASLAARRVQQAQAIARQTAAEPETWAPFTLAEVRASPFQENSIDLCRNWRWPAQAPAPGMPIAPDAMFTAAPTLVLSGDLDVITTRAESQKVAAAFADAAFVRFPNSFHVNALGDQNDCAAAIYRHFVATLAVGSTQCTQRIAPVRTVPRFAAKADGLAGSPTRDRTVAPDVVGIAAAALATAGDAVAREAVNYTGSGAALRGGTYRYDYPSGDRVVVTLDQARWTQDVVVTGVLDWNRRRHRIAGTLQVATAAGTGRFDVNWRDDIVLPIARLTGVFDGKPIALVFPAP